jgi:hypothetical protein
MWLPEREGLGTAPFTGAAEGLPSSRMAPERAPEVDARCDVIGVMRLVAPAAVHLQNADYEGIIPSADVTAEAGHAAPLILRVAPLRVDYAPAHPNPWGHHRKEAGAIIQVRGRGREQSHDR